MKQLLLLTILIFFCDSLSSQNIERVEVNGIILADNNDVESVTIYNTSSNKGTITNSKGEFRIKVALNDIVEISALQFQTVSVTIDADAIQSKQLKIHLIEHINQLDAVLLSAGLSGNIETDITNVKTIKPLIIDMGNMSIDFEYNDDRAFDNLVVSNHLTSILNPEARNYLPDLSKIFKLIFKKDLSINKELFVGHTSEKPLDILDVYSHKFISETCSIPFEKVELFIAFVETKGIKDELFKAENEVYLIEFLIKQSNQFLKKKDVKH